MYKDLNWEFKILQINTSCRSVHDLNNKLVYVIILNWNSWKDTIECVESSLKLTYPEYQILIVDNGSTDGSEYILRKRFPDIKLIQTGNNLGFAGENNAGIDHALSHGADFVWLPNNDTMVEPDSLSELMKVVENDERTGIVGSLLSYKNNLNVARRSPYVKLMDFKADETLRVSKTILFVGAMDRPVNIQAATYFITRVLPLIRKEIPDVQLYVVGNRPPDEIKAFGNNDQNVFVTGFVEDVKSYFLKATVFVAPLFIGGGIITKILDAMAAGLPAIITSIGNEGINALPEKDLLIANTPEDFGKKPLLILKDHKLWSAYSENGKAFVQKHYDWYKTVEQTENDYKGLRT